MKIGNKEIKLYYSNLAERDLVELCGGIKSIKSLFYKEDGTALDPYEQHSNVIKLVRILANGEVVKHNSEIALGLSDGEKKEKLTDEMLEAVLDVAKMDDYLMECFRIMGLASAFEVPENVKLEESDADLAEIEAEKNP